MKAPVDCRGRFSVLGHLAAQPRGAAAACAEGDSNKLLEYVRKELLADIPLTAEEEEKLQGLVEELVQ